jgi:hypothetical protein
VRGGICATFLLLAAAPAWAEESTSTPSKAAQRGSFFLLELSTGLSEPAYDSGSPAIAYSLTGGVTFKLKALPLRFHFLGTIAGRNAEAGGERAGLAFSSSRFDFDLYGAHRIAVPVFGSLRLYGELGLGHRWTSADLRRGGELEDLRERRGGLLVVIAAGAQLRLTQNLSAGIRGELTPTAGDYDVVAAASGLAPTTNRAALMLQLGLHF